MCHLSSNGSAPHKHHAECTQYTSASCCGAATIVLALGNPLRGDDGVALAVLNCLQTKHLPEGVTLLDGGTAGLETVLLMQGYPRAIIIDAADMALEPGAWRRFTLEGATLAANDLSARVTVHYAGLAEALALGDALGELPNEVIIFGIQPEAIGWEEGLSDAVQASVEDVCAAVLKAL